MSESQKRFLDEFTEKWTKEQRDKYTAEVLDWIGDMLLVVQKQSNIIKKKMVLNKIVKENKDRIDRIPIIFIYAVKPEFREKVARIIRIISSIIRSSGVF